MTDDAPFHAHIYYSAGERPAAEQLRDRFAAMQDGGQILFVGRMTDGPVGPHPIPQFEIHFLARDRAAIVAVAQGKHVQ